MSGAAVRPLAAALWGIFLLYWIGTAAQPASPRFLIPLLWLSWLFYWTIAASRVKQTRWRETPDAAAIHVLPMLLAALLLAAPPHRLLGPLNDRFLPPGALFPWLGTLLLAAGLGLAVWARVHLGRNWSGTVTVKEGHTLVRDGPYRVVRHPIYTGLLLAFLGTALAIGEWRGPAAFALVLFAFLYKSRSEEARMGATFPEYEDYRRRSWALLPIIY